MCTEALPIEKCLMVFLINYSVEILKRYYQISNRGLPYQYLMRIWGCINPKQKGKMALPLRPKEGIAQPKQHTRIYNWSHRSYNKIASIFSIFERRGFSDFIFWRSKLIVTCVQAVIYAKKRLRLLLLVINSGKEPLIAVREIRTYPLPSKDETINATGWEGPYGPNDWTVKQICVRTHLWPTPLRCGPSCEADAYRYGRVRTWWIQCWTLAHRPAVGATYDVYDTVANIRDTLQ